MVSILSSVVSFPSVVSEELHVHCVFPRKSHISIVTEERVGIICPWTEILWECEDLKLSHSVLETLRYPWSPLYSKEEPGMIPQELGDS